MVYSKNSHVGNCNLKIIDNSMGVAEGSFTPSENYHIIESTILKLLEVMQFTDDDVSEEEVRKVYENRDNLELIVKDIDGYVFTPQAVHIEDWRKDFPEEGIIIQLLGFSQADREKLKKEK